MKAKKCQPGINVRMTDVKVAIEADAADSEEHSDAGAQADRRHGIAQQRPSVKVLLAFYETCVYIIRKILFQRHY